jgi:hypothetical protein
LPSALDAKSPQVKLNVRRFQKLSPNDGRNGNKPIEQTQNSTTVKTIKREEAKEIGKISIRVEGFSDERSAREYVQKVVQPGLAQNLLSTATRDKDAFIFESIQCHYYDVWGHVHNAHCQGTGPCVDDDLS